MTSGPFPLARSASWRLTEQHWVRASALLSGIDRGGRVNLPAQQVAGEASDLGHKRTTVARPVLRVPRLHVADTAPHVVLVHQREIRASLKGGPQPAALGERVANDMLKAADVAARALGVQPQFIEAQGPDEFARAFSDMTSARAGALTVLPSNMFLREHRRLVDLAAKNRLPAVYTSREFVDAGGLMAYGPDLADMFRRAATYVDKILKGAKPGDLPVEQPTKFELVVNLKTAKALGLTIPQPVLGRAAHIIE